VFYFWTVIQYQGGEEIPPEAGLSQTLLELTSSWLVDALYSSHDLLQLQNFIEILEAMFILCRYVQAVVVLLALMSVGSYNYKLLIMGEFCCTLDCTRQFCCNYIQIKYFRALYNVYLYDLIYGIHQVY
jgi:hypothetical protein